MKVPGSGWPDAIACLEQGRRDHQESFRSLPLARALFSYFSTFLSVFQLLFSIAIE
jgi:hypothetical protein